MATKKVKNLGGRPPIEWDKEIARRVEFFAQYGLPKDQIAANIGISKPTLYQLYSKELEIGAGNANAKIAQTLYQKAIGGDTSALIFWCKTRMGWSEHHKVELTGKDGGAIDIKAQVSTLSDKELLEIARMKIKDDDE